MKPFSLESWRAGEPVITRDGQQVEQLTYFENATQCEFKLMGVVNGNIHSFKMNGKYSTFEKDNNLDLFHPEPEMWVNVYHSQNGLSKYQFDYGVIHHSKEEAEKNIGYRNVYIGTYKLVKE